MKTIRDKFDYFILTATIKNILRNNDRNFSFFRFASRSIVIRGIESRSEMAEHKKPLSSFHRDWKVEYWRVKEYIRIDFAVERTRLLLASTLPSGFLRAFRIDRRRPMSMSSRYFDFFPSPDILSLSNSIRCTNRSLFWFDRTQQHLSRGKVKGIFFFLLYIKSSTYSGAGFLQRCVPVHAIGHWSPPTWNKQKYSVNIGVLAERSKSKVIDCSFQINISLSLVFCNSNILDSLSRFYITFLYLYI